MNRLLTQGGTTNTYNGDGVLFTQATGSGTITYTQDLAAPLSQILADGSATYVYGMGAERLLGLAGSAETWYLGDALGSVRQTQNNIGAIQQFTTYDAWGVSQDSAIAPFGFTGELQQGGNVYLRARWYDAGRGRFTASDPFAGWGEQPYSLHPYQYGYSAPTMWTDPTGACATNGDDYCYPITTWQQFEAAYPYDYYTPLAMTDGAKQFTVQQAIEYERAYRQFWTNPILYLANPTDNTQSLANAFAIFFLGHDNLADPRAEALYYHLSTKDQLTSQEQCAHGALIVVAGLMQYEPDGRGGGGGGGHGKAGRGTKLRLPGEWIDIVEGPVYALKGYDVNITHLGVTLANDAKDALLELRSDVRRNTTVVAAELNDGTRIVAVAGEGRDYTNQLQQYVGRKAQVKSVGTGMHAEEWLLAEYGDRLRALGVSHANGPCYTTGKNCAVMLRDAKFFNVFWDSTFK